MDYSHLTLAGAASLIRLYRRGADGALARGDLDRFISFDRRCLYFTRIVRRGRAAAARLSRRAA